MRPDTVRTGRILRVAAAAPVLVLLGATLAFHPAPDLAPYQPESPAPGTIDTVAGQPGDTGQPADGQDREAIVTLRDGQRYTGILVERNAERVVLRISGIDMPIKAASIDRINVLPPISERYRELRDAIADDDVDALLRLVDWLRARGQWNLALSEVDDVLARHPEHPDAKYLKTLITQQKKLAEGPKVPRPRPEAPEAQAPAAPEAAPAIPLLSERDINIIKVYEVDLANPPRMVIDHATIARLIQEHPDDPLIPPTAAGRDALYRIPPVKILELMFKMQARNLYDQVKILDQPESMRAFRDDVHRTWIAGSCATTRCHGGTEAGRLRLESRRPGTDATVYTNFLILDRFKLADGTPLINYDEPAKSPLLQLGLPRDSSLYQHPTVIGRESQSDLWRPVFRSVDDRRFGNAVDWIKSMYRPRPQYPVQYEIPAPPPEGEAEPPVVR